MEIMHNVLVVKKQLLGQMKLNSFLDIETWEMADVFRNPIVENVVRHIVKQENLAK